MLSANTFKIDQFILKETKNVLGNTMFSLDYEGIIVIDSFLSVGNRLRYKVLFYKPVLFLEKYYPYSNKFETHDFHVQQLRAFLSKYEKLKAFY